MDTPEFPQMRGLNSAPGLRETIHDLFRQVLILRICGGSLLKLINADCLGVTGYRVYEDRRGMLGSCICICNLAVTIIGVFANDVK